MVAPTVDDVRPALGHYVLGDLLGQGSMAEVFAGFALGDHGFQKPVALKRLLPELASNRAFVERLIEQARHLVGMQHRNIVSVLDLARDGNDVFLIMELVYGPSLRKLLDLRGARGLSPGVATYVVLNAAMALEFAHRQPGGPILHADVSPSNLLLTTSGEVCVADFGLAHRGGGGPGLIEVRSAYMAPEQARGEPLTPRADVFALGVVLYELLCGKHPFDVRATPGQRDGAPRRVPPPSAVNPAIPAGLDAICRHALAQDPRQRYQSMQELIDALFEERSSNRLHEGASDLAQAILECSPHAVPRHPSTMLAEQSVTMTVRSLLRDAKPARRTPPPVLTPPVTPPRSQVERPRPPVPPRAPAPVPPLADSGARTTVVVEKRERELLEVPPGSRLAVGTPAPLAEPVTQTEPVTPTAPATPILPVEPVMSAGGYEVRAFGAPSPGAPVGPQPARRLRWMIAIFAAAAMIGVVSAAAFYLVVNKVSPVTAQPPAVAMQPPAAATQPPAETTQPPSETAEPRSVTAQPPPDTVAASGGEPTLPGEPPAKEDPSEAGGDTPTESTTPRKKARGTLRVQTTPWAWVTIGKQKRQTPTAEFKLAPGRYTVRLEFPTLGITEQKKVAIESRKTFTLNIDKEVETIDREVEPIAKDVEDEE